MPIYDTTDANRWDTSSMSSTKILEVLNDLPVGGYSVLPGTTIVTLSGLDIVTLGGDTIVTQ